MRRFRSFLRRILICCALSTAVCAFQVGGQTHAVHVVRDLAEGEPSASRVVQPPCDGGAFAAAFDAVVATGGGTLTFNCGRAVIVLSHVAQLFAGREVVVDGGGRVTLSGANAVRLFSVASGAKLTLKNITITNGYANGDGGAIHNAGTLTVENAVIQDSQTAASYGGGAIATYGRLTIANSTLAGNSAGGGGALYLRGGQAQVTVQDSTLRDNRTTSTAAGWGGAILVWSGAALTVKGSDLQGNSACAGGAIYNHLAGSSVTLENSRVRGNKAGPTYLAGCAPAQVIDGGGIYNTGTLRAAASTLSGNLASGYGGGVMNDGEAILEGVTLSGNQARFSGGGITNWQSGSLSLANATISGNALSYQPGSGGGLANLGTASLTNVTFALNSATAGGAIHHLGGTTALRNTVLADSRSSSNCSANTGTAITSQGSNLADDDSCDLGLASDKPSVEPRLGSLANNGGAMLTHLPQAGSPAINGGQCLAAVRIDQRGVARPQGAGCDIGALERRAVEVSHAVHLPLAVR